MDDFSPAQYVLPTLHQYVDAFVASKTVLGEVTVGSAMEALRRVAVNEYQRISTAEVMVNDQYQVAVDRRPQHQFPGMLIWHLSIRRFDGAEPSWGDLQEIKNVLCGADTEAVELFPAEGRRIKTQGQRFLFAFMGQEKPALVKTKRAKGEYRGGRPLLPLGFFANDAPHLPAQTTVELRKVQKPAND